MPASEWHGGVATPRAIEILLQTRPWVRFLSVLGFIATALMAVVGLLGGGLGLAGAGGNTPAVVMLAYVPLSLVYFFPSLFLWRFADRISKLQTTQAASDMESALEAQRSFWRFVGIAVALVLALYVVLLGLMVPLMLFMRRG
ncbi:MAG TPA: hypothetical protein VHC19_09700 [Pirellulales bacterium]|nr:hypothetical protein [Pirellulales bacterium]